nr:immunoglobulin light chain junction region [Mus musculus]NSL98858.1 immunoglobulin light chain junction region [Mus musculus]NSM00746.1 immunoglobulin light chain junction region [Mus musculus]NSM02307.1 immunoglobulin light chain junction region [Mus musculus]
CLQYDEFPWTF